MPEALDEPLLLGHQLYPPVFGTAFFRAVAGHGGQVCHPKRRQPIGSDAIASGQRCGDRFGTAF
ncbi:hypothetical protein D3C71_2133380 [compost metagenome]